MRRAMFIEIKSGRGFILKFCVVKLFVLVGLIYGFAQDV